MEEVTIEANSSGVELTSKNYPGSYPPNRDCKLIIRVSTGYSVKITFLDFDVEDYHHNFEHRGLCR